MGGEQGQRAGSRPHKPCSARRRQSIRQARETVSLASANSKNKKFKKTERKAAFTFKTLS